MLLGNSITAITINCAPHLAAHCMPGAGVVAMGLVQVIAPQLVLLDNAACKTSEEAEDFGRIRRVNKRPVTNVTRLAGVSHNSFIGTSTCFRERAGFDWPGGQNLKQL